jgi:hypothetical protein
MAIIIGTHPPSWLRNCTRCSAAAVVLFIVVARQKGKMSVLCGWWCGKEA